MQMFFLVEFIIDLVIGVVVCATTAERQVLGPSGLLRSLSPDDDTTGS